MNDERMRKVSSRFTTAQQAELDMLSRLPDARINTDDIPEQQDWTDAKRGLFSRPPHDELAVRVDARIVAWFKTHQTDTEGYEARINTVLRAFVAEQDAEAQP